MLPTQFREQIALLGAQLPGCPIDASQQAWLNADHGVGSAHKPTATNGRALAQYLRPEGHIKFTCLYSK